MSPLVAAYFKDNTCMYIHITYIKRKKRKKEKRPCVADGGVRNGAVAAYFARLVHNHYYLVLVLFSLDEIGFGLDRLD